MVTQTIVVGPCFDLSPSDAAEYLQITGVYMPKDSGYTIEGALKILGHHDPKLIRRLDVLLGGAILTAGALGVASTAGVGLAIPLAALAPIWGWVDQKNEALNLLRKSTRSIGDRLRKIDPIGRREAVLAAHTIITGAAYFRALREVVGEDLYESLQLRSSDQVSLVEGTNVRGWTTSIYKGLYRSNVPTPSPARSFRETCDRVADWFQGLNSITNEFLSGLAAWPTDMSIPESVIDRAISHYQDAYLEVAATVPEFEIWHFLGEHGATQAAIEDLSRTINIELASVGDEMERLSAVLELTSKQGDHDLPDCREVVARSNMARLMKPIIRDDEAASLGSVRLPTVADSFIEPTFRIAEVDDSSRVGSETWWEQSTLAREDLDLWLSGYILSPTSTQKPLLVLGHPGAGKSMIMKVLSAKMPPTDYTTVLVSLRDVGANAPILDQVQQALDSSTNKRVEWGELADASSDCVRVVIFDGLDELLQATREDRTGYLQAVASFQQVEFEQNRPVVAIVTSRTVVADRVDISRGSSVVKLEGFEHDQIVRWIAAWNTTNEIPISAGEVREVSLEAVTSQEELASQPLLLLLLALYSSDPATPPLESGISTAKLYKNLVQEFARREATKGLQDGRACRADELRAVVYRLGVAALAMFNRGRQSIDEAELGMDLIALHIEDQGSATVPRDSAGKRVLGEFFFVHTPEATTLGAGDFSVSDRAVNRAYEFLHATFGEYLVAHMIFEELTDLVDQTYGSSRFRSPDIAKILDLLSHQAIASRPNILDFIAELNDDSPAEVQAKMCALLTHLCSNVRRTPIMNSSEYRPTDFDPVRRIAIFSANLVLLRIVLDEATEVSLTELVGDAPLQRAWTSLVGLWRSGLDFDGWYGMLSRITRLGDGVTITMATNSVSNLTEGFLFARLIQDHETASRLRFGTIMVDNVRIEDEGHPYEGLLARVYYDLMGLGPSHSASIHEDTTFSPWYSRIDPVSDADLGLLVSDVPGGDSEHLIRAMERLLLTRQPSAALATNYFRVLEAFDQLGSVSSTMLFLHITRFPEILLRVPALRHAELYDDASLVLLLAESMPQAETNPRDHSDDDPEYDAKRDRAAGLTYWRQLLDDLRASNADDKGPYGRVTKGMKLAVEDVVMSLRDDLWSDSRVAPALRTTRGHVQASRRRRSRRLENPPDSDSPKDI